MAFTKKTKQVYRNMSLSDLKKELEKLTNEYFSVTIQMSAKPPDNPAKVRTLRRLIALIKTIMREKELGIRK